jgi:hypothetical protein
MLELAHRVPLSRLMAAAPAEISDNECLARYQALLLGVAGLLPSPQAEWCETLGDGGIWLRRLGQVWESLEDKRTMFPSDWHFFKVRPVNSPRRRLAAMSCLLCCFRGEGLLPVLIHEIKSAATRRDYRAFKECLLVGADGFWAENLDFGSPSRGVAPALLGESRAGVIVINVLLPFASAWGQVTSRPGLTEKASDIYHRYPVLAENTLEKHMSRQLGINRVLVNSARRQQGLLHLYKTFCSQGNCRQCPLSG